jgi:hypothetical protein
LGIYKDGKLNALFFQFAGGSKERFAIRRPNGAAFILDDLSNVNIGPGKWHTGPDYARPHTGVDPIAAKALC